MTTDDLMRLAAAYANADSVQTAAIAQRELMEAVERMEEKRDEMMDAIKKALDVARSTQQGKP